MAKVPEETPNPKTVSSDYKAMTEYWKMVGAILHGVDALRSTSARGGVGAVAGPVIPYAALSQLNAPKRGRNAAASPFLPQFPDELNEDYELRRKNAPLTNIYNDISKNLASKPFTKTLELDEATGEDLKQIAENIDGQGNNLHVFAGETFKNGIDKGIDWILIDYQTVKIPATLADERAMGLRPYWVHIPCERLLAIYSDFLNGVEIITHARIYEPVMQRSGFKESQIERVRIFNREPTIAPNGLVVSYNAATWEVHELKTTEDDVAKEQQAWVLIDSGDITIGIIPMVSFKTGKRDGASWKITPPLKDLAYMQIEEFQQESNLKYVKELTAFPMLTGNGVSPPKEDEGTTAVLSVGPKRVLYAPPSDGGSGSWSFIEPGASSLEFLRKDLEGFRDQMRDLGMQPLAAASLTVITTSNISMKAHNTVQAWALQLKDSLEQAWCITAKWLNQTVEPEVHVHTDFGVDFGADAELASLLTAEAAGIISKATIQDEFKRRGVLGDDFDPEEEMQKLAEQQSNDVLTPEAHIDPVTGMPIVVQPKHGILNPPPQPVVKPTVN